MWRILIQIEPEQGYWQAKYWGDWTYDDESLIYDKIKGKECCFLQEEEEEKEEMREGEMGGLLRFYNLNITVCFPDWY